MRVADEALWLLDMINYDRYIFIAAAIFLTSNTVADNAKDISHLMKGSYVPKDIGCSGAGGASSMQFDGRNLSGHYQVCITSRINVSNNYLSTCLEGQAQNWPSIDDVKKEPSSTKTIQNIDVKSKYSFNLDGRLYIYCKI